MQKSEFVRSLDFIDSWLSFRMRQVDIPGCAVAICHKNQIIFSQAYGYADTERAIPLTTKHLFRIASLTKLFTATLLMKLQEEGKIAINNKIADYLSWTKVHDDPRFADITIRQLLSHSSGLVRDGSRGDYWHGLIPFPDSRELHKLLLEATIYNAPNRISKYSNLGFGLLGEAIEKVTGRSYAECLTEKVIKPLNLTNTYPEYSTYIHSRLANGYTRLFRDKRQAVFKAVPTNALIAATGVCATAEDTCLFLADRLSNKSSLLVEDSIAEMHRPQVALSTDPRSGGRGLGCVVRPFGERTVVTNIGSFPGYHTIVTADIKNELIVAVFTNSNDAYDKEIMEGIYSVFDYFESVKDAPLSTEQTKFEGRFFSARGADQFVAHKDGVIAIKPDSWRPFSSPETLTYLDSTTLFIAQARDSDYAQGETVCFDFTGSSPVVNYAGKTMWTEEEYVKRLTNE
jgi:D-alanyl-D-alanine carboxypeptidase